MVQNISTSTSTKIKLRWGEDRQWAKLQEFGFKISRAFQRERQTYETQKTTLKYLEENCLFSGNFNGCLKFVPIANISDFWLIVADVAYSWKAETDEDVSASLWTASNRQKIRTLSAYKEGHLSFPKKIIGKNRQCGPNDVKVRKTEDMWSLWLLDSSWMASGSEHLYGPFTCL